MGRKPVQGSCGGLNNVEGLDECELCGGSPNKCKELKST
ncbi:MAG: (Na+)-NQR maturation NqrM [Gammaproteobacteria bacterium]